MRIAIVSLMGGLRWGGSEALWNAVALHALKQGDEVFVSVYDWGKPHHKILQLQTAGATIYYRKKYNPNAGTAEKIIRFIKKRKPALDKDYQSIIDFKPDIVFISQGDSFDFAIHHRPLYLLLRKHAMRYAFVCHSHMQFSFIPPKEIFPDAVELFKNATHVFFVSHRQWQLTERRLATKLTNGCITWNPLNIKLPNAPLSWPQNEVIQMAMVGNISDAKGHDTALEVLSAPKWKKRQWILNIYGEGEGKIYLQALAAFYGIAHRIIFHGHVDDIVNVWHTNHLLLIPSAGEGLPISLVEAMACGRPAVVTDVGGNTELIKDHDNGFVAVSPTTAAFAAALESAWLQKAQWNQLGQNAFECIKKTVDADPAAKLYKLLASNENNHKTAGVN
ncbi:MAG: glycosyltransferase family 4 protein [Ferruginibacter sp.]|nr:glycosyltransferase family 4 protein [Ferruginibacter sp.]